MRRFTKSGWGMAMASAAALAAGPALADAHKEHGPHTPVEVQVGADELLEPYYARLRSMVDMPDAGPAASLASDLVLTRLAFGSCNHHSASQHMWDKMMAEGPQLFMMIGDNVYGDDGWDGDAGLESLRAAYAEQAAHPEFARFRAAVPMMATWDDHDYGLNDAGGSFPMRRWAEALFESFWNSSDAVRARPGVHDSVIVGPEGRRVQLIVLDTRFFRSDLTRMPWSRERPEPYLGVYLPNDSADATVLGAAQWAWLEQELAKPADLRIVASSIQILTEAHNFESWENFPRERVRLLDMLAGREESGLVLLSGDRHSGGIYQFEHMDESFWELTSSSLNLAFPRRNSNEREPDPKRVSDFISEENFGLVDVDWDNGEITLTLKGNAGQTHVTESYQW